MEARRLANAGDHAGALARVQALGSGDADALLLAASIHFERGDWGRAEVLLRHLLMLNAQHIPALLQLVLIAARRGDPVMAKRYRELLAALVRDKGDEEPVTEDGLTAAYVRTVLAQAQEVTAK